MRNLFVMSLLSLLFTAPLGCGDADSKPSANVTTPDAGMDDEDAGEEDAGGEADAGEAPFGETCAAPGGMLEVQQCSLVDQDCDEGACGKRILLDDMQMPTGFAVVCGEDVIASSLGEGDPCDPSVKECPNDMVCKRFGGDAESFCRKWCRLEDGYGCRSEQACAPNSDLEPVFGICVDACPG